MVPSSPGSSRIPAPPGFPNPSPQHTPLSSSSPAFCHPAPPTTTPSPWARSPVPPLPPPPWVPFRPPPAPLPPPPPPSPPLPRLLPPLGVYSKGQALHADTHSLGHRHTRTRTTGSGSGSGGSDSGLVTVAAEAPTAVHPLQAAGGEAAKRVPTPTTTPWLPGGGGPDREVAAAASWCGLGSPPPSPGRPATGTQGASWAGCAWRSPAPGEGPACSRGAGQRPEAGASGEGRAGAGTRAEATTCAARLGPAPASRRHALAGPAGDSRKGSAGGGAGGLPKWVSGRHPLWHWAQRAARDALRAGAPHRACLGICHSAPARKTRRLPGPSKDGFC